MFRQGSWQFRSVLVLLVVVVTLLVVSISVVSLLGCGGGGGGPTPAPELSGKVTAPQGTPVAQAPSFLQRLASLFISVAEAQALRGQAVADATVKAFIWPNVPPTTTTPVATTKTDDKGRYILPLPADTVGKDIVLIAEKSVEGGTLEGGTLRLRLSTIVADVPEGGKTGENLDAATTLATEEIVKVAKGVSDLSPNAIASIISEVRKILEQMGTPINLLAGHPESPIPLNFGEGLQKPQQIAQQVEKVEKTVDQQKSNLPAPTGNVATAKSIVQMLRDFGISAVNLPETEAITILNAVNEQQEIISKEIKIAEDFLKRINFPARALGLKRLGDNPGISSPTTQRSITVYGIVYDYSTGWSSIAPNATVEVYIGGQKVTSTTANEYGDFEVELPISQPTRVTFVAKKGEFVGAKTYIIRPEEYYYGLRVPLQSPNLFGLPPGRYEEVWVNGYEISHYLKRIGDASNNRTWEVKATKGDEKDLVLTVTVSKEIGIFRYTHEAGKYTFQVRKTGDASLAYDGSITATTDAQGNPVKVELNATVKDSALKSPITFSGTLEGTPAQTGNVTGEIRSPTFARKARSRQSSDTSIAPYTEAKFVNVSLQSQFGTVSIGELKVLWLLDTLEPEKVKQISLTNLRVSSQTSKPVSLVINNASVEFEETTPQEKKQYGEDIKPTNATFSATIEGSGLRLQVSNMKASEFVFVKAGERWNWQHWAYEPQYRPVPRRYSGQVSYSSSTLTFNGSVDANWENLQGPKPKGFGKEKDPVNLASVPKGTFTLKGNWKPDIGRPAGINLMLTSKPEDPAPQVKIDLTLDYGDQKLSGTIKGTLDIRNGQSYGFKSGDLDLTHSPSNFRVQVSQERDKPVSGKILDAQGQKVADIGRAKDLELPDLGETVIVKYRDNTFETLESVLPRSRMSRR